MGGSKRKQPAAQQQKLAMLPLVKKPLSLIGTQIKVPGAFWEGMMTAEERSTLYLCNVPPLQPLPLLLKQLIEENIAKTQVEVIANCWKWAEEGHDTLTEAAKNATDLLTVREAMEARDEQVARRLSRGE